MEYKVIEFCNDVDANEGLGWETLEGWAVKDFCKDNHGHYWALLERYDKAKESTTSENL